MSDAQSESFEILYERARHAHNHEDLPLALQLCQQARACAHTPHDHAKVLNLMGRTQAVLSDYVAAATTLAEALQLAQSASDVVLIAQIKNTLGIMYWLEGKLDAAKQVVVQARAELRAHGAPAPLAGVQSNLGLILYARGEYQQAIAMMEDTVNMQKELQAWPACVVTLTNLGECYHDLGDFQTATEHHRHALEISATHYIETAPDTLRNLGIDLLELGLFEEAELHLNAACEITTTQQRQDIGYQVALSLARLSLARGNIEEAITRAEAVLAAPAGLANHAQARLIIGRSLLARGATTEAIGVLSLGVLDAQASNSKRLILELHATLATVAAHPALAEVHGRIAAEIIAQIADSINDKALRATFLHSPLVAALPSANRPR